MSKGRTPINISVQPWFKDHCFGGKIVLPAVETMHLLAARVAEVHPELDVRDMEQVRFAKFLEISPGGTTLSAFIECVPGSDGTVHAKLLSRLQIKTMSRIKEHGEVVFSPVSGNNPLVSHLKASPLSQPVKEISADHIYRQLVPFGPWYHTLQESLYLSAKGAWGKLKAPDLPQINPLEELLGSPFPLDGAFHAACVLGQQSVDFIPFPVGFDRRVVVRPTQPGCGYITKVVKVQQTTQELVFDLGIFNQKGELYEAVTGLRMRDVSKALR